MKSKVVVHANPYFLQNAHYTAITMCAQVDNSLIVTEDGEQLLKAGTIYPANDATAQGIVLRDVVMDPANGRFAQFSLLTHGFINEDLLPVALTTAAKTALQTSTELMFFSEKPATGVPSEMWVIDVPKPAELTKGLQKKGTTFNASIVINAGFTKDHDLTTVDVTLACADAPLVVSAVDNSDNGLTIEFTRDYYVDAGFKVGVILNAGSVKETPFASNMAICASCK